MQHFEEIWFDFDGTLAIQSERYDEVHNNLRYTVYADHLGVKVTDNLKAEYEALYAKHHSNSAVFRSLGLDTDYWMAHYSAANMNSYYEFNPTTPKVIETLSKRGVLGIFTNNRREAVEATLERLKIPISFFSHTLTGDEIKEKKPHPHGFEVMLQTADCEPEQFLYIGDRYNVDIEPVQKLGAKGGLLWANDKRADFSFPKFEDLLEINK